MEAGDKWAKLEEIVRRVVREEIAALGKKPKIELVNGRWVGITQEQREAWQAAYGAVDLDAELRRAAAWCVSNPSMAPRNQIGRFLNTWLTREQNRLSLRAIPTQRPSESRQKLCEYCARVATSSTNGIWSCDEHSLDAMDGKPRPRMLGVVPKPVAGRD